MHGSSQQHSDSKKTYEAEDLSENIVENESDIEDVNSSDDMYHTDHFDNNEQISTQQFSNNSVFPEIMDIDNEVRNVDKEGSHKIMQQSIFDDQQTRFDSNSNITDNQEPILRDKENDRLNSYNFTSNKKRRLQIFQDSSNNPIHQHNIYRQAANRNLEDYRSKMEHQMRTKYNIHEPGEVLPLGPREFSELDDPPTNTTVSVIEAARLQSNAIAGNKICNCR
ncbi:867_t:CDS:2, partial [Racocetra fulgida]